MDRVSPRLLEDLTFLYGPEAAARAASRLDSMLGEASGLRASPPANSGPITERDALLITYPDQLPPADGPCLPALKRFLDRWVAGVVSTVHLLPFYPSSSDDGFSVMDYLGVDPRRGSWDDVRAFGHDYRLMVDVVLNHASARGEWFEAFRRGEQPYRGYFLAPDLQADWSHVVRPRTTPLFTTVETVDGPCTVWTTFSPDQVDLNYANPDLLLAVIGILLEYLRRGAQWLRLDAIGFLWKEAGTACLHNPQTHRLLRVLRQVVDTAAPWARLVSETNVGHDDNVAYFGQGHEAHMVYQFPLPPLVVHTLLSGDSRALTAWASHLARPPAGACFLNFLASHDGIGLLPAAGWLTEQDIERLLTRARACGGASYRTLPSGDLGPYELNVNLLDVLVEPASSAGRRFVAAHAILLSLAGIPAIYFHSLFGSHGDSAAVARTGAPRSINREKLAVGSLEAQLSDPRSERSRLYNALKTLLQIRATLPALHPDAAQKVLDVGPLAFGVRRDSSEGQQVFCLAGVGAQATRLALAGRGATGTDLVTGEPVPLDAVPLDPLQVRWIVAARD